MEDTEEKKKGFGLAFNKTFNDDELRSGRRPTIKFWSTTLFETSSSAYELKQSGESDSFCGATISWYNPVLRYFQTISCLFTAACLFLAPYQYFFKSNQVIFNMNTVCDMIYFCVILFRSRTSHMIDGVEERNLLKVRRRYQSSLAFILDIITYLPLAQRLWPFTEYDEVFYLLNRQTILLRLHYILYHIETREKESGTSTLLYRTTKYILLSTLAIHFAACGWYGLACTRTEETVFSLELCLETSWIRYLPQSILEKVLSATKSNDTVVTSEVSFLHNTYITSLYWASGTVTSTGYGDIHAYTVGEKVFSLFAMIVGMSVLYGMTMGGMTSMLTNIDARRSRFVHRYQSFKKEVSRMEVSDEVTRLSLNYFEYLWRRLQGQDVHRSGFLKILPECMRAKFTEARYYKFLRNADLLKDTEDAFLRNLSMVCKPRIFLENQFIQKSGEISDEMCYLHHGILEVLDNDEKEVVALLNSGKLFGQVMLVYDLPRINSVKCRTNCDVFVLSKRDFKNVLSEYPESAATFLEAARNKCGLPSNTWPLLPPNKIDFTNCLQKTASIHRRKESIANAEPQCSTRPTPSYRRLSTISAANYTGVELSRVQLRRKPHDHIEKRSISEKKPSFVEFIIHGDTDHPKRSATHLADGTKVIATSVNYKELEEVAPHSQYGYQDPDYTTLQSRLFRLTLINPKGKFYRFWLNLLFVVSLIAGVYPTFVAFFTTTPGEQKLYTSTGDDDLYGENILLMAADTCNTTEAALYNRCPTWPFNATVKCIKATGGSFAWRIVGNATSGYQVRLPARYDLSLVAYSQTTDQSRFHHLFSILVLDVPFYLNILVNLRTKVTTPNGFLTSFKDIAMYYNRWNKLWLDLFGIFPLESFSPFFGCSLLASYHAIAFLRLNRVLYFFRYVPTTFTRWEYSLNVKIIRIRTIKFLVYIYSITHMCACATYWWSCGYITQTEVQDLTYKCHFGSWAWVFDVSYLTSEGEDYIKTMYWASTTMTSTGYGDISASTTTGRIFALMTMIIGTVMYGWLVAVIASTISNSTSAEVEFHNHMTEMKNYLAVHLVSDSLIHRVMRVRRIEWERYAGAATPGKQSFGKELSKRLRDVLVYESLNRYVECLPFFHGVDPAFVAMLCKHIKIYHYSEGDMVIYEGDLSKNLYIIKKGHCTVVTEDLSKSLDHLTAGDYFGECEMLFGCSSPRTIVTQTACELLVIEREDVDSVLDSFPLLQLQMQKIKEDAVYKHKIRETIEESMKAKLDKAKSMVEQYHTEFIEEGYMMYTDMCIRKDAVKKLLNAEKSIEMNFLAKILSLFLLPYTFDPLSKPYVIYETVRVFLIIVNIVIVPFQFAFLPSSAGLMVLQYLLDGLALFDLYIKAHTAYYNHKAILVTHPTKTALKYLRTSCLIDFLSCFPFELIVYARNQNVMSQQQWRFLAILRVTRLLQAYKLHGYFSYCQSGMKEEARRIKTFRNIIYGLAVHHWFSCILFISACTPSVYNLDQEYHESSSMVVLGVTGVNTYCRNSSWISNVISNNQYPSMEISKSISDQYIVSFYWATATLVCVGYGDIYALHPIEMFFATVVMICGTVFYSFILGSMAANIQNDDFRRGLYKTRLSDIIKFFKVYNVSITTREQVLDYYYFLWDRTSGVSPERLFEGLPPSIRTSLCQSMYGPMIREAFEDDGIVDKETEGFFRLMSTHITPALYMKNGVICRRNDVGDEMFFIQRGSIAILDNDEKTVIRVLGPGQHFGEIALLFAVPRSKTIKAVTNCELNILSKKDLDNILEMFPQFRKKMTVIAQDRKTRGARSATYEHQASGLAHQLSQVANRCDETKRYFFEPRVINRDSFFSFFWENATVILAFLSSSLCVYQACFYSHNPAIYVLGYFIDAWFISDMFVNYHTSFIDQFSTTVTSLKVVHLHYAKSRDLFFMDAIANAPLEFISIFVPDLRLRLTMMCYARLNRILRMYRLVCIFSDWEKDIRNNVLAVRLYQSLLCGAFTINFISSVWYGIACPNGICRRDTWITSEMTNYVRKRIYSFDVIPWVDGLYWTVATMTSTGYGDIRPLARFEMIYACSIMVLGKLLIGYVLGMMAATLANDESLTVWYKQNVSAIKKCMRDHKFDKKLYNHIVQYYEYMWMKNQSVNVDTLFPDLSFSLRADIFSQICGSIVNSMGLFQGCPSNFLRHVCMILVPSAFMPGDYICLQGDVRSEAVIIYKGVAEILKDVGKVKVSLGMKKDREVFLAQSVLCKIRRPFSLRARSYVDVFTMSMEGLQGVLKFHPRAKRIVLQNAQRLYPDLNL